MIKDALKSYEEKSQKLQVLRGQLANYLNEELYKSTDVILRF
jgi:hypothetical protein